MNLAVALGGLGCAAIAFPLTAVVRAFATGNHDSDPAPASGPSGESHSASEGTRPAHGYLHVLFAALLGAGAAAVGTSWLHTLALCAAAIGCSLLTAVDIAVHRLPRAILLPTYAAVIPLLIATAAVENEWDALIRAGLAALALGAFYFLLGAAAPTGIGFGDVTFAPLIGLVLGWFGWVPVIAGTVASFVAAAVFALGLMAMRRANAATRIAFGPWMVLGAAAGLMIAS